MNSKVAADVCSARLSPLLPVQARSHALLGFQAVSGDRFNAFDFLGDGYRYVFLRIGYSSSRRQRYNTFVGFNFDVGTWNAFFGYQVSFDLGGDPGIGSSFFSLCNFTGGQSLGAWVA